MRIPADLRVFHWTNPITGVSGSFRPLWGSVLGGAAPGQKWDIPHTDNPQFAARLIVPVAEEGERADQLNRLVELVAPILRERGEPILPLFYARLGDMTTGRGETRTWVNGAHVFIFGTPGGREDSFRRATVTVAEDVAAALHMEEIVVECQRNGQHIGTTGVAPR